VSTLSEGFHDEGEREESEEDDIEFLEAGENASEPFQPAKVALDLIAFPVKCAVVFARLD